MFEKEKIYIAGPECFYTGGYDMLAAMKSIAEAKGFGVTLPNDHPLDMENPDLRKRADSIFADLKKVMLDTTVIIADLEAYRGSEPDSGTIYEIGMAYAKGARCYGYTRDKRPLAWKDQKYTMCDGLVYDEHGKKAPYKELPFSPNIIGSTKIIEGDFDDCLKMLMTDIEEEKKQTGISGRTSGTAEGAPSESKEHSEVEALHDCPVVYLAGPERYDEDAKEVYAKMKELCKKHGLYAVTPLDWTEDVSGSHEDCSYTAAAVQFSHWQQCVRDCDAVIADLNDYRGYECSNDVAFECGMGFQLGKKLFGYLSDGRPAKEKVPNLGASREYRDMTGANVEDFNYPVNLMFACSMDIMEGGFEDVIARIAQVLHQKEEK